MRIEAFRRLRLKQLFVSIAQKRWICISLALLTVRQAQAGPLEGLGEATVLLLGIVASAGSFLGAIVAFLLLHEQPWLESSSGGFRRVANTCLVLVAVCACLTAVGVGSSGCLWSSLIGGPVAI